MSGPPGCSSSMSGCGIHRLECPRRLKRIDAELGRDGIGQLPIRRQLSKQPRNASRALS